MSDRKFETSLKRNVPLAPLTTLRVGGPARYFVEADNKDMLELAIRWSAEGGLKLLIMGGGSNLLLADGGFDGLVVKVSIRGLETAERSTGSVALRASAGEPWDDVVGFAVERGLAGIESISGVPGLVGATPIQNVGAYGQEVSDTIAEVEALDLFTSETVLFKSSECGFGYRTSRFKTSDAGRYIVTAVTYHLSRGAPPIIRYPELRRVLTERGMTNPSLLDVRRTVIEIRRKKGMVIDPADPDSCSAGSFFINPIVTEAELDSIKSAANAKGIAVSDFPVFPASGGRLKIPAAWLIEKAGFNRGYRRGNAGVSTKHPLAIVNLGAATAGEILSLAREIAVRVKDVFGVALTPEPVLVGFDPRDREMSEQGTRE